jgi:hypothetical protein
MSDQPSQNKMVTGSAARRWFHFSGDGIYHNLAILATNMEEATKEWLAKRQLINAPSEQSTPAPVKEQEKSEVQ